MIDMTREEALKIVRENYPHFGTTEPWLDLEKALATLVPELRESEDERIRKWIASYIHHGVFTEDEHPMALKAMEGEVHPDDCEIWVNLIGYGYKFNDGDKVKVIVIKDESK